MNLLEELQEVIIENFEEFLYKECRENEMEHPKSTCPGYCEILSAIVQDAYKKIATGASNADMERFFEEEAENYIKWEKDRRKYRCERE